MTAFRSIEFQKQLTIKSEPITPQITIKSNSVLNTSTNQSNLSPEIKSFDIRQFSNTLIGLSTLRKRIGLYRETPYRTTNFRIALTTLTSALTSIFRSPFVTYFALREIIIISCLPTDSLVHLSLSLSFSFCHWTNCKMFLDPQSRDSSGNVSNPSFSKHWSRATRFIGQKRTACTRAHAFAFFLPAR